MRRRDQIKQYSILAVVAFITAGRIAPYTSANENESGSSASDRPQPNSLVLEAQRQRIAAIAKPTAATVGVFGTDDGGGGSGVIISPDGYVLTNFHVSSPFGYRMRCGLNDGKMYEAILCGIDPTGDLALLKMYGRDDFPTATIADSDTCEVGQWCYAIGNPFVLNTNLQPTVTYGILSGVHRYQYPSGTVLEYSDCLQTDAAINPGNSGGPLFNADGNLIGINGRCSFEKRGRVNVGVGYAISINQAMNFLGVLKSGRIVDHATFGFTASTDENGEVLVSNILDSCDAYRRGLRFQDRILEFAGYPIKTTNQLKNYLGIFPANWRLPLVFEHDGRRIETFIRLESLHRPAELDRIVNGQSSRGPRSPRGGPDEDDSSDEKNNDEQKNGGEDDATEEKSGSAKNTKLDVLADKYIAKSNFGNYYFNLRSIDRIVGLQSNSGSWKEIPEQANVTGTIAAEPTPVRISLNNRLIDYRVDDYETTLRDRTGYSTKINEESSESIAVALQLYRLWHTVGPKLLGATTYIGTAPVIDRKSPKGYLLHDKTQVIFEDLFVNFYTDPDTGEIRLIEIEADPNLDPAEVYLSGFEDFDGVRCPTLVELRFGMDTKTAMKFESWKFADPKNETTGIDANEGIDAPPSKPTEADDE